MSGYQVGNTGDVHVHQTWDEYAAGQRREATQELITTRTETRQELVSIRKTLQGILFVLVVIGLVVGIPLMYAVAQ